MFTAAVASWKRCIYDGFGPGISEAAVTYSLALWSFVISSGLAMLPAVIACGQRCICDGVGYGVGYGGFHILPEACLTYSLVIWSFVASSSLAMPPAVVASWQSIWPGGAGGLVVAIASRTYLGAVGPIEGSAGRSSIVAVVALLLGGIVLLASRRHSVAMGSLSPLSTTFPVLVTSTGCASSLVCSAHRVLCSVDVDCVDGAEARLM